MKLGRIVVAVVVVATVAACSVGKTHSEGELRGVAARADSIHTRFVSRLSDDPALSEQGKTVATVGFGSFGRCKGSSDQVGYHLDSGVNLEGVSTGSIMRALETTFDELRLDGGTFGEGQIRATAKRGVTIDLTATAPDREFVGGFSITTSSECLKTSASVVARLTGEAAHEVPVR